MNVVEQQWKAILASMKPGMKKSKEQLKRYRIFYLLGHALGQRDSKLEEMIYLIEQMRRGQ